MGKYIEMLSLFGVGGAHPGGLALTKEILSKLPLNKNVQILDVGCGTGQTIDYLSSFECPIIGIDSNHKMVEKAKARCDRLKDVTILLEDLEDLPFSNDSFDYIISESVLSFTNIEQSLYEIFRVLKPNGYLVATELTIENSLTNEEENELISFYGFSKIQFEDDWVKQLKQQGFKKIKALTPNQFSKHNHAQTSEIRITEPIPEEYYSLMERHTLFNEKYKDRLTFRVLSCIK
ncbi:class I SAM-dependent methyltransferase [Metabacillus arenae]|uniref:Class I SAM-dependent methyltransferase n=1 Tax=Metabacillus arenae TaxID=2771434 RepID=A0A926NDW1_9BACI|nr:class I SAM-dependent methyltransferase [Metabacillus arenae]MBD1379035.1 class I SAM-dependent methyltransferase [Metabacillus arenae]